MNKIKDIFLKKFLSIFYDKKYLEGRWFSLKKDGYKWALRGVVNQKLFRNNRHIPWPCSSKIVIGDSRNITFDIDDLNNFQHFGCYFQNYNAHIYIGKGSYIAPNVGLITQNHKLDNLDEHESGHDIVIGSNCWIGMNSVVLPGVILGDKTIVGAGSVVTKSYPKGNCVIAGNPAKLIRELD